MNRPLVLAFCAAVALGATGCATTQWAYDTTRSYLGTAKTEAKRQPVAETESTLIAAGFHQIPAKNSDELKQLKSLPPHQISYSIDNGRFTYRFADPDYCRCVFQGDDAAYQRYERLSMADEKEQNDQHTAVIRREAGQQEALDSVSDLNPFRFNWF